MDVEQEIVLANKYNKLSNVNIDLITVCVNDQ